MSTLPTRVCTRRLTLASPVAWVLLLALLLTRSGLAQPTFFGTLELLNNDPVSIFPVDVDADGDLDVLVVTSGDDVLWLENDGGAGYSLQTIMAGIPDPRSVFGADVDGDGDMDVLVASAGDDTIRWFENDGAADPAFTDQVIFSTAEGASDVFASDLDRDGDVDVLSTSEGDGFVRWFENDGQNDPAFTERIITMLCEGASSVFAEDVDTDGDTDVICTCSASSRDIQVLLNNGNPNPIFDESRILSPDGFGSYLDAWAADADGDGDRDVLVTSTENGVQWIVNLDGRFNEVELRDVNSTIVGVAIAGTDVENDGDVDILSAALEGSNWFENDGADPPDFRLNPIRPQAASDIIAVDFDQDGRTDLLSARVDALKSVVFHENRGVVDPLDVLNIDTDQRFETIEAALGNASDGHELLVQADEFFEGPSIDFGGRAVEIRSETIVEQLPEATWILADDAAISTSQSRFMQLGPTTIPLAVAPDEMILAGVVEVPAGIRAQLRSARIRSEPTGLIEIGVAGGLFLTRSVQSVLNGSIDLAPGATLATEGDLTLATPADFAAIDITTQALSAFSVHSADVDGDGDQDVLSASRNDNSVRWYVNGGGPSPMFIPQLIFDGAMGAFSVFASDLDGDSDIDVLSSSILDDTIRWYENDGEASPGFTVHTIASDADQCRTIYARDIDGDGDTDVVSGSIQSVRWYENDGMMPPGFIMHEIFAAALMTPTEVFASDVNGDGFIDVLSSSITDNRLRWYESDGQMPPGFTSHEIDSAGSFESVRTRDIDGDGDEDIIAGISSQDAVIWYENDGQLMPEFTRRDVSTDANAVQSVRAGDLNADGLPDILVASAGDDTVRWYRNRGNADPRFASEIITDTAIAARSVFASDLNDDGLIDVLSASSGDNAIRWYRHEASTNVLDAGAIVASEGEFTNSRPIDVLGGTITSESGFSNGAAMRIFGTVSAQTQNDVSMTILADTQHVGDLTNNGSIIIQNGMLNVIGMLMDNGTIIGDFGGRGGDGGGLLALDGFQSGSGSSLLFAPDGVLACGGDFDTAIDANTRFDLATSSVEMSGANTGSQNFEAMSRDIGADRAGLDWMLPGHFPIGTLRIGPTASEVDLVDDHDNALDGQAACEAVYTSTLIVEPGCTLNTNGCRVYYEQLILAGSVDDPGSLVRIADPCQCDWTGDGSLNSEDFFAFLVDFFAGNGDINQDGATNSIDFFTFLECFLNPPDGCM